MTIEVLLSGIVVFVTHTVEAITGFGCTVLALPFVTSLIGITNGVIALTVIGWLIAVYFAVTKWKHIDFKQYFIIVACMIVGLPIGIYMFRAVDVAYLKRILAVFICVVSAWQLFNLFRKQKPEKEITKAQRVLYFVLLVAGGIVHGMFSSGGPFVVLYSSKMIKDKGRFRATMCMLWTTLNLIIIVGYFVSHSFNLENVKVIGCFVPFLFTGIFAGEKIHDKVNAKIFSIIVFAVLLLTGVVMLIQS